MDEFYYFDKVLSGSEIAALYNQNIPSKTVKGILSSLPTGSVGLYYCYSVNTNYIGPILKIRASTDSTGTSATDFYIDNTGTIITTASNGQGIRLINWLKGATAYVQTWYDQSGAGNHATQTTTSKQPTYDSTTYSIYFNGTSQFLYIDSYATMFPNTGDIYLHKGTI